MTTAACCDKMNTYYRLGRGGMKDIVVPEYIEKIMRVLRRAGIRAYLVGGCVRDAAMGRTPYDYDITAAAVPSALERALSGAGYSLDLCGARFGTVAAVTGGVRVEVTSMRRESGYSDMRRPDLIEYTDSLEEDLARRDFTVNAMAYSLEEGLCDPFGGMTDISAGLIRCVGDPYLRFEEDALRILRALRFSAVLGFGIEKQTAAACREKCENLYAVSGERVFSELIRTLCGSSVESVLRKFSKVICCAVPEIRPCVGFDQCNPHHDRTVYDHIIRSVACIPPVEHLRLTMFFHDIGKPGTCTRDEKGICHYRGHEQAGAGIAEKTMSRMGVNRALKEKVEKLILFHDIRPEPDRRALLRYYSRLGIENAEDILLVRRADVMAQSREYMQDSLTELEKLERLTQAIIKENACMKISDLAIGGKEVIEAAGICPGPQVGQILERLLSKVIDGDIDNERAALYAEAAALAKEEL